MAALVVDGAFDIDSLGDRLEGHLSSFARPVFLRLQPQIDVTGTFKQRKVELVREGFDPSVIADPLYWFDPETRRYERLDAARYGDIALDRVKL
jgi:fatty-acyl-CoA synthase